MKLHRILNIAIGLTLVTILAKVVASDPAPRIAEPVKQNEIGIAEAACQIEAEKQADITWVRAQRSFAYTNSAKTEAESRQVAQGKNAFNATVSNLVTCKLTKAGDSWAVRTIKITR